jgi:hypothetical protein
MSQKYLLISVKAVYYLTTRDLSTSPNKESIGIKHRV